MTRLIFRHGLEKSTDIELHVTSLQQTTHTPSVPLIKRLPRKDGSFSDEGDVR